MAFITQFIVNCDHAGCGAQGIVLGHSYGNANEQLRAQGWKAYAQVIGSSICTNTHLCPAHAATDPYASCFGE
jgi:hypothetical protein